MSTDWTEVSNKKKNTGGLKLIKNSYKVKLGEDFKKNHVANNQADAETKSCQRANDEQYGTTNTVFRGSEDAIVALIGEQPKQGLPDQGKFTLVVNNVTGWQIQMATNGSTNTVTGVDAISGGSVNVRGFVNKDNSTLLVTGIVK